MQVTHLGEAGFPSPVPQTMPDDVWTPALIVHFPDAPPRPELRFEVAGPRAKLFFDPAKTRAGIVTCGGLCPGLNTVIRSLFLELHHIYGVAQVLGFRYGYQGLDPVAGLEPMVLTPAVVDEIHRQGGTLLGTSRGPVDPAAAVDNLIRRGVDILFTIGGDGTQRGANVLYQEAKRRGHALAVVGIPKTIDNDVPFVSRTFGFQTAVEEACRVIDCAHTEARSVQNGISLVKLMGREAGFIAAGATVASQDVNFTLVPEVPFALEGEQGLLAALTRRIWSRRHAVVVVAEGAGQEHVLQGAGGVRRLGQRQAQRHRSLPPRPDRGALQGQGDSGDPALFRSELHHPQSPGRCRGLDPLRSLRARCGARRHGRKDGPGDRDAARRLHPCADRLPGLAAQADGSQQPDVAGGAGRDRAARPLRVTGC